MIIVWRGRGFLALVATFLPLASCAGLMDFNPVLAVSLAGIATLGGGLACRHYGRKWNQGSGFHTMYWIPLEIWGWIYIVFGGLFSLMMVAGLIRKALGV